MDYANVFDGNEIMGIVVANEERNIQSMYKWCEVAVKVVNRSRPTRLAASSMACWHFHFLLICRRYPLYSHRI